MTEQNLTTDTDDTADTADDAEGHMRLRADEDDDDAEGHIRARADEDDDDAEGHMRARADEDDDDAEGHMRARADEDDDDAEGHAGSPAALTTISAGSRRHRPLPAPYRYWWSTSVSLYVSARQWRMPNHVRVLTVPDADRAELERLARSKGPRPRVAERARIVLLAAAGLTGAQIAGRAGCTEPAVVKWRRQCAESGLAGLEDAPRPGGRRRVLTDEVVCEILAATVTPPPEWLRAAGVTHWSSRRLVDWLQRVKGPSVSHDSITVLCLAAPGRLGG